MQLFKRTGGCFEDVAQESFGDKHYESQLEEWIHHNPQLIADDLMMIGRQVVTEGSKRIDLLAVNREGDTVIIELKRGDSPRDLQAQIDEYVSAVESWSEWELEHRTRHAPRTLQKEFRDHFKCEPPAQFNTHQTAVVVVENIDETSLRTFKRHGTRVLKFSYLKSGEEEYILVSDLNDVVVPPPRPPKGPRRAGREEGSTREDIARSGTWCGKMQPDLAREVFPAADGWQPYNDEGDFSFWLWRNAGFHAGLGDANDFMSVGIQLNPGDESPGFVGVECDSETVATRLTEVIRQHEEELKARLGDFVLSQDHKESDGSWDSTCPVCTYVPDKEDAQALAKHMMSYRDALSGYLDEITPRLAGDLAAFERYCERAQPELAREVFNRSEGWKQYTSKAGRSFGFFLWGKAGFYTAFDSPDVYTQFGLTVNDGDQFPRDVGVYCDTKAIGTALTELIRANEQDLRTRVGDFVLSADHPDPDGSWEYRVPVWAYLPDKDDIPALVKKTTAFRDALTGYIDQVTPRTGNVLSR